jgi:hypothetical protein
MIANGQKVRHKSGWMMRARKVRCRARATCRPRPCGAGGRHRPAQSGRRMSVAPAGHDARRPVNSIMATRLTPAACYCSSSKRHCRGTDGARAAAGGTADWPRSSRRWPSAAGLSAPRRWRPSSERLDPISGIWARVLDARRDRAAASRWRASRSSWRSLPSCCCGKQLHEVSTPWPDSRSTVGIVHAFALCGFALIALGGGAGGDRRG